MTLPIRPSNWPLRRGGGRWGRGRPRRPARNPRNASYPGPLRRGGERWGRRSPGGSSRRTVSCFRDMRSPIRAPPPSRRTVRWGGRPRAGYRGSEPADEEAIVEALLRVSRLSCDFPEIQELDINPLLVLPKGKGIRAIDCRMTIAEAP